MSQVEVISRVERRRRFTPQERAEILAEAAQTSVSAVCRRLSLSRSLIQSWRTKELRPSGAVAGSQPRAAFARLALADARGKKAKTAAAPSTSIRLEVGSDMALVFPATVDPRELAQFVAALKMGLA